MLCAVNMWVNIFTIFTIRLQFFIAEIAEHTELTTQILLEHFKAESTDTFISVQEIQDILLSDQNSRYNEDFVDDVLDTEWLTDITRALFPGSKDATITSCCRRLDNKRHIYRAFMNSLDF